MLAAADAAAGAGRLPKQFCKKPAHIAGEGHIMPMATMVGKNEIHLFQLACKGNSRKFLPDTGMNSTIQLTQRKQFQKLFFHFPDLQRLFDDAMIDD